MHACVRARALKCIVRTSGRDIFVGGKGMLTRGGRAHAPLVGHGHHADCVLWIGVDLGLEQGSDGVCECAEACGLIVAVSHVL
jgi:hypothetical protein